MSFRLIAKIEARNQVHELVKKNAPAMFKVVNDFIGKKVCLATGGFSKAFKDAFPYHSDWHLVSSTYNIKAYFKVCVSYPAGECGCCYADATLYLAEITNGLTIQRALDYTENDFKSDYTFEYVTVCQLEIENAKKALSQAQAKIFHFC